MYATAHRVSSPRGDVGINAFLHKHGSAFPWPEEAWRLPESDPGVPIWDNGPEVRPGGNRVHSYLDVLVPDDAGPGEIEAALVGLSLELASAEMGRGAAQRTPPNPLVYRQGRVVLRFGVEADFVDRRAQEMAELRRHVELATAHWYATPRAS